MNTLLKRTTSSRRILTEALEARENLFGDRHVDTLSCMNNLAWLLRNMGVLEESEALFERALAGRREALGEEHKDTLTSMSCLASALQTRGKLEEAEVLSRLSLAGV